MTDRQRDRDGQELLSEFLSRLGGAARASGQILDYHSKTAYVRLFLPRSAPITTIGAEMITQLIPTTFFCVKIVRAISN